MDSDKWGFCRKTGRAVSALAILALGVFTRAQAQTLPPNAQQGVDWLSAQVRSDGSLATDADTNVEYIAHRIIAAGSAARDADAAALLAAQNADGGWGPIPNLRGLLGLRW